MKDFLMGDDEFNVKYTSSKISEEYTFDDLHDAYEFVYCIKSDMKIFIDNSSYEIKDGDMFFINPNVIHHIFYNKINHYERYVIHFKKSFISDLLRTMDLQHVFREMEEAAVKKVPAGLKCSNRLDTIFRSFEADSGLKLQRYKLNLMLILLEYYEELKKNRQKADLTKKAYQSSQIVKYLDAHFCEEISLDMLEKEFFLNKYHISHIFKEATGFSVFQYIQYRRVLEAQRLLTQTGKDIDEVGFDCGFNNLQSFYKVFGKITGSTPGRFKRSLKGRK